MAPRFGAMVQGGVPLPFSWRRYASWARPANMAMYECDVMTRVATNMGVPIDSILKDPDSTDTRQQAVNCREIMKSRNWRTCILVSRPNHLDRAKHDFSKALGNTNAVQTSACATPDSWWYDFSTWAYEVVATAWTGSW